MTRIELTSLLILALETGLSFLVVLGSALAILVAFLLGMGFLTW